MIASMLTWARLGLWTNPSLGDVSVAQSKHAEFFPPTIPDNLKPVKPSPYVGTFNLSDNLSEKLWQNSTWNTYNRLFISIAFWGFIGILRKSVEHLFFNNTSAQLLLYS